MTKTKRPVEKSTKAQLGCWGGQFPSAPAQVAWIWDGFLAPGNVTLLTSQWKLGKTTLIANLLARLKTSGSFAARPVRAARAVIVSEEGCEQWRLRQQKFDLRHVYFILQPFRNKPTHDEWVKLLEDIAALRDDQPFDVVVIDTLTTFLPGRNEAQAGVMMESLLPLRRLTDLGLAVLLLHHPPKGQVLSGQAARGTGALSAFTDINVEMTWALRSNPFDRRRRLTAYSRHEQTPRQLVLELNAEGTDYLVHGDFADDEFTQNWQVLRMVLRDSDGKKTRQQLLADWPADFERPSAVTLLRWLQRAESAALIAKDGDGRRAAPFRYWLPECERAWRKDGYYLLTEQMEETERRLAAGWGEEE